MFICLTCRIITDITSQYGGETVHVCGADCFGIAVEISNHDCSKYQEQAYTPEGILFSKCIVCDEAAQQSVERTAGSLRLYKHCPRLNIRRHLKPYPRPPSAGKANR